MIMVAEVVAYVLLAGLAVFQIALAAGAPLGHLAWGGRYRVLPRGLRIASVVAVGLYVLFALIIRGAVDSIDRFGDHSEPTPPGIWVLTAWFGLGTVLNLISRSRAERLVQTPVAAVLCICCLLIALA